ncbi:MAG: hypothetical protein ACKO9D_13455, partial [Gammaproteobacteria bacterium]
MRIIPALAVLTITLVACTSSGGPATGSAAGPVALSAAEAGKRLVANRWELVYWEGTPVPHGDNG